MSKSKQVSLLSIFLPGIKAKDRSAKQADLASRLVGVTLVGDFLVSLAALVLSFWIRFGPFLGDVRILHPVYLFQYFNYFISGAFLLSLITAYRGIYHREALLRFRHTSLNIVQCVTIWFCGFLGFTQLMRYELLISRLYVLIATATLIVGLLGWRYILNRILHQPLLADALTQKVLLVGWNETAARLAEGMTRTHNRVYRVIGCLTSDHSDLESDREFAVPFLGKLEDLDQVIRQQSVSTVIVSEPSLPLEEITRIANLCERAMVQFKIAPTYFQILVSGLHLQSFNSIPVLEVSKLPLDNFFNVLLKRTVDIFGSVVGILLSSPLIIAFGILIYRESPGPIFFAQERRGRAGRGFKMFKLRSMKLDADKSDHLSQSTLRGDPRMLKIGALMRRLNIDEIPQFWNVLKGDMSLVGPRPERVFHSEKLSGEIPHYQARHNVKPGITGWAQVKGLRGDTDLGERIQCDIFYLENWSLLLDFQVMAMTFLGNKNAV